MTITLELWQYILLLLVNSFACFLLGITFWRDTHPQSGESDKEAK